VQGPVFGLVLEDNRNLIYYVVGQLRLLSKDSIAITHLSFDGAFAHLWDWGSSRPTAVKQLMDQCTAESKALTTKAKRQAGVGKKAKKLSKDHKTLVKYQLVQAALPLIQYCVERRTPPGVPLHPTPLGTFRTALQLNREVGSTDYARHVNLLHRFLIQVPS